MDRRWKQIRELFDAASQLDADAQLEYLNRACQDDADLRNELEQLLSAHQQAGSTVHPGAGATSLAHVSMQPGVVIGGRYRIEREIGEGGFAIVYLARDQDLVDRPVVVKIVKSCSMEQWRQERFREEIDALAKIDHPGIVGILDVGETEGSNAYLVMQYIEGPTLRNVLSREKLATGRVLSLGIQLTEALEAAHKLGVLHRDLKPENVIVRNAGTADERAVIIDFGIARVLAMGSPTGTTTTHVAGSPVYMAPEQFLGKTSAASDVFSLGSILIEMLTGHRLNAEAGPMKPEQKASVILRRSLNLPKGLRNALTKAVSLEPEQRFSNGGEMRTALKRAATRRSSRRGLLLSAFSGAALSTLVVWTRRPPPVTELMFVKCSIWMQSSFGSPVRVDNASTTFRRGDRVRLRFETSQAGYLWLFNESPDSESPPYHLLYPGSSPGTSAEADRVIEVPKDPAQWIESDPDSTQEIIWFIWSPSAIAELERLRTFAAAPAFGEMDPTAASELSDFLFRHQLASVADSQEQGVYLFQSAQLPVVGKITLTYK